MRLGGGELLVGVSGLIESREFGELKFPRFGGFKDLDTP